MRIALLFAIFALLVVGTLTVLFKEFGLLIGLGLLFWAGKGIPFGREDVEALLVIAAIIGVLLAVIAGGGLHDISGAYY